MKAKLIALLAALLVLLAACAAPAPESESAPMPESIPDPESEGASVSLESAADPEPQTKDVSRYYIEDTSLDGIEDEGPVEALSQYLLENLTPKEYGIVDPYADINASLWPEETVWIHSVRVVAPDKAPIDALLQNYEGPYAPVWFYQNENTLSDMTQAREDIESFLAEHPEIKVVDFGGSWPQLVAVWVEEITDELTAFVEGYPIKDILDVMEYSEGRPD